LPWIGDVPVLGSLFKSSSYQKHETELVVIVTPRLVQPASPNQLLASPLDKTQLPTDPEFFALGQMEVTPAMLKGFKSGDGVVGPYGYIIDLGSESGT
jgi:pilus assembly protein CpaC